MNIKSPIHNQISILYKIKSI